MPDTTLRFVFQDDSRGGSQKTTPNAAPGAAEASSRQRREEAVERSKKDSGKSVDPFNQLIGQSATKFLNQYGALLGRLPFFNKTLELLRLIARGVSFRQDVARRSAASAANASQSSVVEAIVRGFSAKNSGQQSGQNASGLPFVRQNLLGNRRDRTVSDIFDESRLLSGRNVARQTPRGVPAVIEGTVVGSRAGGAAANAGRAVATRSAGTAVAASSGAASGAGAAAGGAAALGPLIVAALAVVAVVGAAVLATKALIAANNALRDHFRALGDRLAAYSSQIQASNARQAASRLRDEVAFARELGGRIASFNDAQARIERSVDRIWRTLEGPFLDSVTPVVEAVAIVMEKVAKDVKVVVDLLELVGALKNPVSEILKIQNQLLSNQERDANKLPPEADILGAFGGQEYLTVEWNGSTYGADETSGVRSASVDHDATIPTGFLP